MFSVKPTAFDLFDYCEKCYSPKTVWLKCLSVSSCDASKYVTSTVIGISPTISTNRICLWSHTRLIAISRRTQGASQPFWIKKIYGILHSATANPARTTSNVLQFIHRGTFWNDETCHYCAEYSWKWVEARLPLDRRSFVRARGLYNPER